MDLIQRIEEILINYYKDEANLIKTNINSMIENFENNLLESSKKEKEMISKLIPNLNNGTLYIENKDYNKSNETINNLENTINTLNNISIQIKNLIQNQLELKENDYFLSQFDINFYNNYYNGIINNAKIAAENIDSNLIHKKFDEIMGYFKQNFTNDLLSMGKEIEQQFYLEEEPLKDNLFKNKKTEITDKFKYFREEAINEIKRETERYENKINKTITNFLIENEEELNSLIYDLYVLFSNESLIELAELYDKAFNSSLNTIANLIENNSVLAKEYFDDIRKVVENTSYIETLIHSFQNDSVHIPDYYFYESESHRDYIQYWNETITDKKITKAYISKYNEYKANINYSENYINNQLYLDLVNNYKNPIVKLRKILQSIKNNKLNEKYPNFSSIGFNQHKKIIDLLYNRLDSYLSDDLYNEKYINPQNNFKTSENEIINQIKNYIEYQNNNISKDSIKSDYEDDYCVRFKRIKSYLCTNGNWHYPDYSDDYCLPVSDYTNNHLYLKEITINSNEKLNNFINKFNEFFSTINNTVDIYNSKINKLKSDLKDIEDEIMNEEAVLDYISEFQQKYNFIFENYYGDKLVISSYDKYKNNVEIKIEKILNISKNTWIKELERLKIDLENNKHNFTSSIIEFKYMALIYNSIISQNISKSYYDSIINEQKNSYNYTISYYYNYLLRLANLTQNYIVNRILKNHNTFNYLEEQRINLINQFFQSLMENITLSEKNSLNLEKQLYILGVEENDFFKLNSFFKEYNQTIYNSLSNLFNGILYIDNNIGQNQYSLIAKMYFENI